MKKMNKKGVEMTIPLGAMGIILILISAMFLLDVKRSGLKEVGDTSMNLITAYGSVEKELFYLDSSVRISAEKASKEYKNEQEFIAKFEAELKKLLELNDMPTDYQTEIKDNKLIGKTNKKIWSVDGVIGYEEKEGKISYSKNLDFSYPIYLFDFEKFKSSYRVNCLEKNNNNLEDCFDVDYDFESIVKDSNRVIVRIKNYDQVIETEIDLNKGNN
ncbi:MAG: hypothetical protein PHT54_03825 [Candidatus Nanoarchaeia archaeon]|nr:hypothetical protein [Candidatus Nanoarchaeia archaeon]